jgi:hypothetical protein
MMLGRGNAPARTEADISAALTELAQRAPGADAVLSAMRDAGAHQQDRLLQTPGPRGLPGRWRLLAPRLRWPQLTVAVAAAVTAIVLAVVLTPGSAPVRTHGSSRFPNIGSLPSPPGTGSSGAVPPVAPGHDPSTASVAKAMLAAFNATAGDLILETDADFTKGSLSDSSQFWSWPAVPDPGQLEYMRSSYSQPAVGGAKGAGIKLTEDIGYTGVVPRPSRYAQNTYARLIDVCYAGTGQTGCGFAGYETPPGTWSMHTGKLTYLGFPPNPGGADLARQIARGQWRILGHTRLNGQQAIKLAETRTGHYIFPRSFLLWVSATSYLPLRMVSVSNKGRGISNWNYLPPTKANLAQLRVPIPPGYRRSG